MNVQLVRNIDNGLVQGLAIQDDVHDWVLVEDIKIVSIVTHEQFESMKYIVGGKEE